MSDRRIWTFEEEELMISILEGIVAAGGRGDTGSYRSGTYDLVAAKMREKITGIVIELKHVQNKMKRLKDKYSAAYDMLNTSGFGWDETKKCVVVDSPEILTEYLKKHLSKNYTANRSFPFYERLQTVFGKNRATGNMAESAADALDNMGLDKEESNTFEIPSPISQPEPVSSQGASVSFTSNAEQVSKRKRKRTASSTVDITHMFEKSMEQASADISKIAEVLTRGDITFSLYPDLQAMGLDRAQIIRFIRYFANNPSQMRAWNSLADELKPDFVKSILEDI